MSLQIRQQISWSNLPDDILSIIFHKLKDIEEISQCAAVCLSWQSVLRTLYRQLQPFYPPFLLLSNIGVFKNDINLNTRLNFRLNYHSCALFNTRTHKLHYLFLPELNFRWFCGSSDGWLLTVGFSRTQNLHLLNPFTRDKIILPPATLLSGEPQYLRVITSTSPLDPNCIFLATNGSNESQLSICRKGDKTWKNLLGSNSGVFFSDVICFKGYLFAISVDSGLLFNVAGSSDGGFKLVKFSVEPLRSSKFRCYLVELKGNLLLVRRFTGFRGLEFEEGFHRFAVYRLDWCKKKWIKVKSIGDYAILLGLNSSISLAVGEENNYGYLQANCIYFIEDVIIMDRSAKQQTGVFNLVTQQFQLLYQSAPIWRSTQNLLKVGQKCE